MNNLTRIFSLIAAGWLSFAPAKGRTIEPAQEPADEKPRINLTARVDWLSRYMFRGFALSEGPVMQPSIAANYRDVTLIGFGNLDEDLGKFNEADFTVDYTRLIGRSGKAMVSVGYTNLTFPNTDLPETQEVYAAISIDTLLNPSLAVFHDFDEGRGNYIEFSINHDFKLGEELNLSATARLGYNGHYFRQESGFSHYELSIAMPIPIGNFTIAPSITRTESLDDFFQSQTWSTIGLRYDF